MKGKSCRNRQPQRSFPNIFESHIGETESGGRGLSSFLKMDITSYLGRIGYLGSVSPTEEALCAIHRAHMLSVPFENLDIARSRRLVVEPKSNVRKIVELRRGGFCYELNGAFASLLQALGFKVTLLSARVGRAAGGFGPEFDHLTLQVDLEEPCLLMSVSGIHLSSRCG
jgi:arylamine N-acetyltransferase